MVAGATVLAPARSRRLAPWFLLAGTLLLSSLWSLGWLRIPWPDLGVWTAFVLNPYLLATLSLVLMTVGAIGTIARFAGRFRRSPKPDGM